MRRAYDLAVEGGAPPTDPNDEAARADGGGGGGGGAGGVEGGRGGGLKQPDLFGWAKRAAVAKATDAKEPLGPSLRVIDHRKSPPPPPSSPSLSSVGRAVDELLARKRAALESAAHELRVLEALRDEHAAMTAKLAELGMATPMAKSMKRPEAAAATAIPTATATAGHSAGAHKKPKKAAAARAPPSRPQPPHLYQSPPHPSTLRPQQGSMHPFAGKSVFDIINKPFAGK